MCTLLVWRVGHWHDGTCGVDSVIVDTVARVGRVGRVGCWTHCCLSCCRPGIAELYISFAGCISHWLISHPALAQPLLEDRRPGQASPWRSCLNSSDRPSEPPGSVKVTSGGQIPG